MIRPTRLLSALLAALLFGFCSAPARAQDLPDMAPDAVPALVPLEGIKAVSTGSAHTCALTTAGGVKCWGRDIDGQIGDGPNNDNKPTPVDVVGLTSGVQAIAAGGYHTCALTIAGGVKCWGLDAFGQVGDGPNNDNKPTPVDVTGLTSGVQAISAGGNHTCAVTTAGGIKCWGQDLFSQIGDGNVDTDKPTPVDVFGLTSGMKEVSAGFHHTCAVTTAGGAKCWGLDTFGQAGDGTDNTNKFTPVDVVGLTIGVQSISTGALHACALTTSGGVRCWGRDEEGQIGDGANNTNKVIPANVAGLTFGVQAIAAGGTHTCVLTTAGGVKCWGEDRYGQVGDGADSTNKLTPVDVLGLTSGVPAITEGGNHTCALTTAGGVKCWGQDNYGQVGDGPYNLDKLSPVDVLTPKTCFKLTRASSGAGTLPAPSLARSAGCPLDHYLAATTLFLQAIPNANQRVQAWSAPASGGPGATVAALTMPAQDSTVTVTYAACRALTRSPASGAGALRAAPAFSAGCASGRFAPGEAITLVAAPGTGQRVASWAGAAIEPGVGLQVNALTMPDANRTVSVAYEACFALSLSVVGQGTISGLSPTASSGCVQAATFAAGESVTLAAQPAAGHVFAGWSGGATGTVNPLVVAVGGPLSITATFVPAGGPGPMPAHTVWLPNVAR